MIDSYINTAVGGPGTTACPPTCNSSVGQLVYFPDGLRTITGGGD
jgi:hypothetical protein